MRIGIISDTHDNLDMIRKAIEKFVEMKVELIIHCGDMVSPFSAREFKKVGDKLIYVYGNNDGDRIALGNVLRKIGATVYEGPLKLEISGIKFMIYHGFKDAELTKEFPRIVAEKNYCDYILYGHTHKLDVEKINNSVIINPGECCGYLTGESTIAVLDTESKKVDILKL
ncbi:MAG: metallophosphoesterase [Candidatus Asgardarchaeia archaeon]